MTDTEQAELKPLAWTDGWHLITSDDDDEWSSMAYMTNGVIGDDKVTWFLENGYVLEPMIVMTPAAYEAELEAAKAGQVGEWEPVPDGWYDLDWKATERPENPVASRWSGYFVWGISGKPILQYVNVWSLGRLDTIPFNLGDTALCRRVASDGGETADAS